MLTRTEPARPRRRPARSRAGRSAGGRAGLRTGPAGWARRYAFAGVSTSGKLYVVEAAFPIVVIVICLVAIVVALVTFVGAGKVYENLGRGAFALDESDRPASPEPGSGASRAEADAEIRQ